MLKFGVVGYGTGGRHFHTPFIAAAKGCALTGIVARAPATVAAAQEDWPGVPVFASLGDMIRAGVCDAVTITTPPHTRRELVLEAIAAGLHVIADKPFAPDAASARDLGRAAEAKGIILGVYQNRRHDSDMQTLARLVRDGRLGRIWRVHSRMDQDGAHTLEAGPTGGLLRDLGSHVVDQMIWLLGPVVSVDAQMDFVDLPQGRTDAGFTITLRHASGAHSHVEASKLNHVDAREFRAYGELGSYASMTTDVQAQCIFAGKRPADDLAAWGYEPEANWGTLRTAAGAERIPAEQGRYHDYYEAFARAVREGTPPPVSAEEGARTLAVLDAARKSAAEGRSITV
ncbi:MAG: Gfo/Idh/MocA family oxidoreductase [Rhodobacterales bacterium]|nr:Gfo/Idh/MocA family oxidoreductase [Rhodobacterales bacterium]